MGGNVETFLDAIDTPRAERKPARKRKVDDGKVRRTSAENAKKQKSENRTSASEK